MKSCASSFILPRQSREVIADQGAKAMVALFGGNCADSLPEMRYHVFVNKLASAKSFVIPERLPPTLSST